MCEFCGKGFHQKGTVPITRVFFTTALRSHSSIALLVHTICIIKTLIFRCHSLRSKKPKQSNFYLIFCCVLLCIFMRDHDIYFLLRTNMLNKFKCNLSFHLPVLRQTIFVKEESDLTQFFSISLVISFF